MGIGGHMLGPRKLRRLNRLTGRQFDRAYRRGRFAEGRITGSTACVHYSVDPVTGEHELIEHPWHWSSCPR